VSEDVAGLVGRRNEALRHINEALAKGDKREVKAWRTIFSRINLQLSAAGYLHWRDHGQEPL
jgi:hypothetical protein